MLSKAGWRSEFPASAAAGRSPTTAGPTAATAATGAAWPPGATSTAPATDPLYRIHDDVAQAVRAILGDSGRDVAALASLLAKSEPGARGPVRD